MAPPYDESIERAALGCVLGSPTLTEVDEQMKKLRLGLFYDLRHRKLYEEIWQLRADGHALDLVVLTKWLKDRNALEACGGLAWISGHQDQAPSLVMFGEYVATLRELALRRFAIAKASKIGELAGAGAVQPDQLKREFADILEQTEQIGESTRPLIEIWTIEDARAYKPDPSTFMVGANLITRGEVSLIAGWQGLGKSRLANTLAYAGARGQGDWMGYEIKRRFRTLILQSENSPLRIKDEFSAFPPEFNDFIRISLPCHMQFANPAFRAELRRMFMQWYFDLIVVDNMNDVSRADGREEFLEGLDNIRASLPAYPDTPAVFIVAHLNKVRNGEAWTPRAGRELMHAVSGSLVLTAKARTVFVIQPASMETDDDRIIFETAKCNNDVPLPRSAWHRRNGVFDPIPDFDFQEWLNPPEKGKNGDVSERDMERIFLEHGPAVAKGDLVKVLRSQFQVSQATAYRYADPKHQANKFRDHMALTPGGNLVWK